MDWLSEIRDRLTGAAKLLTGGLALLVLVGVAELLAAGFVLYRVLTPVAVGASLDPQALPGNPSLVRIEAAGIVPRDGLFFPGQRSAPTILLAHGYRSSRNDLLTLAIALQENKYNVFLFNFSGHGETAGWITFGHRETRELAAALEAVAQRDDIDRGRFGIFGVNLGGYAALAAAAADGRVRAVVVESVYFAPRDMMRMQVERSGMARVPLLGTLCRWGFHLLTFSYRNERPVAERLTALRGVAKLFVQAQDDSALADTTLQLFLQAPEPRQQVLVPRSSLTTMSDAEKRAYELQVINFLLQALPPLPRSSR